MTDILLVIIFVIITALIAVLLAPWWLGRMLLPSFTFAFVRKFSQTMFRLAALIKPDLDMSILVKASNRYYATAYENAPYSRRVMFLPFCLKPRHCPALVSRHEGLMCESQCAGCTLGDLRKEALALGYGWVYVVPSSRILKKENLLPSSQFIKQKITEHQPLATLGVICAWHLRNRLLPSHKKISNKGYVTSNRQQGAALHGLLLKDNRQCFSATVDWQQLRQAMYWPALPPS